MRRALLALFALAVAITPALMSEASAQARRTQPVVMAKQEPRCLRAFDGKCTKPAVVEAARLRAIIFPSIRVSYYGTPAGTIPGGSGIERFFRDNPVVFGLPTHVYGPGGCCINYTK